MKKIIFILITVIFSNVVVFSQNITGTWNGTLSYEVFQLRIVFHISEKDGVYATTIDSPDQGVDDIETKSTVLKGKKIRITIPIIVAEFDGKVKKNTIEGTFNQMGKLTPLVLSRGNVEVKRPQDPSPPFPYYTEYVYFKNEQADITLVGTFTCPEEGDNFPVAVLISGSGAQNRDEEVFNHRPFAVLSDYLARNGIATLRYDDRGVGESQGIYHTATIQDFATDASAAVTYLKKRQEIDTQKIGLIGHSEGASIAFILTAENADIAFVVSMAGVGIRGDWLMIFQRNLIYRAMGLSEKEIAKNEDLLKKIYTVIEKHTADSVFKYPMQFVDEIIPLKSKVSAADKKMYAAELMKLASPELQSFMAYDPVKDFDKMKCHVFAINGEKDLQVPPDILVHIEQNLKNKVEVKRYPNLNHLFQHAETGLPTEYGEIEETISPEVLEDIVNWIKKITNNLEIAPDTD